MVCRYYPIGTKDGDVIFTEKLFGWENLIRDYHYYDSYISTGQITRLIC